MISFHFLLRVLEIETALFLAIIALLLIATGVASRGREKHAQRMRQAREWVARWLNDASDTASWSKLLQLSRREQIDVLHAFHPLLSGESREQIRKLAVEAGIVELARKRCKSLFWSKRLEGAWLLTICSSGEDIVPAMTADRVAPVRLQAAEWIGENPSPESIKRLIGMLNDDDRVCRHRVQDVLLRIGHETVPALNEFLTTNPQHDGAWKVAALLADSRMLDNALKHSSDTSPRVREYALALLGKLGGEKATSALRNALTDPEASVRLTAVEGLLHLNDWQAGSAIAKLLRDPSFACRKEAALTLLSFGSPGTILLNRALESDDRYAADMAKQVLESAAVIGAGAR